MGALPRGGGICRSPKQPSPAPRGMLSRAGGRHKQGGLGARLSVRGTPRRRTRGLRSCQTPWHIPDGDTEPAKSPSTAPGAGRKPGAEQKARLDEGAEVPPLLPAEPRGRQRKKQWLREKGRQAQIRINKAQIVSGERDYFREEAAQGHGGRGSLGFCAAPSSQKGSTG